MATLHFAELIVQMTEATVDHEHIPMVIWNQVNIADRTSYMLGKSTQSPLPAIVETLHSLEQAGAEMVADTALPLQPHQSHLQQCCGFPAV